MLQQPCTFSTTVKEICVKIPNAASAIVPERKIVGYLLNRAHEKGGPKARFFLGHGYTLGDWQRLANDLRRHARTYEITGSRPTWQGINYEITGDLTMPDGLTIPVVTVWYIANGGAQPQLVTAHPLD